MPGPFKWLKSGAWLLAGLCLATSLWIGGRQPGCDVFFALMGAAWLGIAQEAGACAPAKRHETPQASGNSELSR